MIEASTMEYGDKRMANVTLTNGRKELSITVDNGPLARTEKLYRGDIRVFVGKKDVTSEVFNCRSSEVVRANVDSLSKAVMWLQRSEWGFEYGMAK